MMRRSILLLFLFLIPAVAIAQDRPNILLTNDDGIDSIGIRTMAKTLSEIGTVTVVAPAGNESGIGHAATTNPRVEIFVTTETDDAGITWHSITAHPSDCVRLGIRQLMDTPPDIVVSGPNSGANLGFSTWLSGTLGAAREGAMHGIPSIAVSMVDGPRVEHYLNASRFTARLIVEYLETPLPEGSYLTVNYPALPAEEIRGTRIVPLAERFPFVWDYVQERTRDGGLVFRQRIIASTETDRAGDWGATTDGYISVTPIQVDQTDHDLIPTLGGWRVMQDE